MPPFPKSPAATAEDILNAASHLGFAEAKLAIRFDAPVGANVIEVHSLAEDRTQSHIERILGAIVLFESLCRHLAQTLAFAAYEEEREAGDDPHDLPALTPAALLFLHMNFVVVPRPDQSGGLYRCDICEGVAETEAGLATMHSDCCPLVFFDGTSGRGAAA